MAIWKDLPTRYVQQTITPGEGVDTFRVPTELSNGQASDMRDFSTLMYPSLRTRKGRDAMFAPIYTGSVRRIHVTPSGIVHASISGHPTSPIGNTDWVYWNPNNESWDFIATPTNAINYHQFANWYNSTSGYWDVYKIVDELTGPVVGKWDGSAYSTIAYATYPCVAGPICSHGNRLFTTPNNAAGNLGYSKLFDPSVWTSPDGGIIQVGANDRIVALVSMSDRLFIGTTTGIYVLFGLDAENFSLSVVNDKLGIPDALLYCSDGDCVYFSDGKEVYKYTPSGITCITRHYPNNSVYGGIAESNTRRIYNMAADGKRLYVASNEIDSDDVSVWYVYDIIRRTWMIEKGVQHSWTPTAMTRTEDNRIIYVASYSYPTMIKNPRIMELGSSNDYDTTNQYNLCVDMNMTDETLFTALAGVDAIVGGFYQVTGNGTAAYVGTYQDTTQTIVSGHKVYARIEARVRDANCLHMDMAIDGSTGGSKIVETINTPTIDTWYTFNNIITLDGTTTGVIRPKMSATYVDAATQNGKNIECRYIWVDDISFTYGVGSEPIQATYEADMPVAPYGSRINVSSAKNYPAFSYTSPAFQIRPSDKKTLANIWITADLTDSLTFTVSSSRELNTSTFTTIYTMPSVPTLPGVVRIKVPVSANPKSDFIRVKIDGTGQATIINMTLDWRVVRRAM